MLKVSHRFLLVLPLWFAAAPLGCGQVSSPAAGDFIFRMAQTERTSASCLLVGPDGKFHLEQQTARHDDVFEGTLRPDKLADLQRLLNGDPFQKLLPDAVESSLQPTGLQELMISVPRQGHWLNLRYIAGMIPDRHKAVISHFQKWKAGVLKSPHRKLNESSGRSNCLPPEKIEFKPRE